MKKLLLVMISMLVIGVLAACGSSENGTGGEKKVLKMATSADYPPFEYIDTAKGSDIIGFDVDLAKAIGKELGYEIKVEDMDFTGLIPALQANKADLVLAGMTPTADRKESVDFSDVYYTAKHMIVAKKGSGIESIEDLEGKTVGVQLASIQEGKAEEISKEVNIKVENRNRIPELIQEMKSGRFDAAIIEDTVAKGYFENDKELEGFTIEDGNTEEAGSAIAFPKDSKHTEEFNKVLQEMKENGELEKLVVKWFGGEEK
ncbi:transporter substrate-binding domain-containing protein [Bacillus sp. UMB0893]|uniref:transporter substrate-binding domain-containing protein n=1 Tax=Bacillus sp. UMB0893 TaxID=2066053 RepID=UPI000C769E1E|nr:transporter substrate-binding domain-containing protein [Bacillus sp. UMB0893]PLR68050.1 ABC transporter substrate-binding protein [Bacillus sp. UMB0893]QNG61300.1 transporter substrate-binding domain-containing protein [Bacillus sp. PAMC26568]